MALPSYMKQIDDTLYFNGDGELIYYVPKKYFDLNIANVNGEYVSVIGIFRYGLFDKSGKLLKLNDFKCPTVFKCKPSLINKVSKYHLDGTREPSDYRLLIFRKDDELISNLSVPMLTDNVEYFLQKLFIKGHLPTYIPYEELYEYVSINALANDFNFKVSNQIVGILISELCRNPEDLSQPFRYVSSKSNKDYKMIRITEVPKYISPYTAITSENPDEAVAAALTTSGNNRSPLEKIMMS